MKPDHNSFESFLETGKIDDYLSYCQNRKQELYAKFAGGALDAVDDRWDNSVGLQDE